MGGYSTLKLGFRAELLAVCCVDKTALRVIVSRGSGDNLNYLPTIAVGS